VDLERKKLIISNENDDLHKASRKRSKTVAGAWWFWRPINGDKNKSKGLERLPYWLADETPLIDSEDGPLIKASVLEVIIHKLFFLPGYKLSVLCTELKRGEKLTLASISISLLILIFAILNYIK